jgi:hypothetical protein
VERVAAAIAQSYGGGLLGDDDRDAARAALREISDVIYEQWPNDVRVAAWLARCGSET